LGGSRSPDRPGSNQRVDALLRRARAGEESAFTELSEPHRRELLVHCYRIVGSVQDAEDLVQETLWAGWRGLHGFGERGSFRSWLYTIATNRSLNALRDRRRRPPEAEPGGDGPAPPAPTRFVEPLLLEPFVAVAGTAGCAGRGGGIGPLRPNVPRPAVVEDRCRPAEGAASGGSSPDRGIPTGALADP
jgi:hypothetical protein